MYVQAGFLEDRPPGSVVREAVLTDPELTERQKQMMIEVYESFRKETAMARAEAGEIVDDQTGLPPDEAALTWPENLSPAALARRPAQARHRHLYRARGRCSRHRRRWRREVRPTMTWLDEDDMGPAGLADGPVAARPTRGTRPGRDNPSVPAAAAEQVA